MEKCPTTGSVSTESVTRDEVTATRETVGRFLENRLFIEFLGLSLGKVNATLVRWELNKLFDSLFGGPDKGLNIALLL